MAGTGSRGSRRRGAGELESEVLAVLWATDHPLTPAEIRQSIGGRRGAYRPARNAAELTAQATHEALGRGPDPFAALRHFVTGLSAEEERVPRKLLDGDYGVAP
ncbi:CopY family transcriptional regulator [Streptomyces nogalater]|uniref:CopY family transcriptional regulator n=1 Tax=Streptomyces nogalater TaxID=38314 RepID=A0ABW0WU86_STRNO